jgi:uncharacterized protein
MDKQKIIETIQQARPILESRYAVARLGLFGSYLRGEERRASDIDLLVSFRRDVDLFEFLELRAFLQENLHHKVDLVMDSALKPAIGKHIRAEVEYV